MKNRNRVMNILIAGWIVMAAAIVSVTKVSTAVDAAGVKAVGDKEAGFQNPPSGGRASPATSNPATRPSSGIDLEPFKEGVVLVSKADPTMRMYYWFFEAASDGGIIPETSWGLSSDFLATEVSADKQTAVLTVKGSKKVKLRLAKPPMEKQVDVDIRLTLTAQPDGAMMELTAKNVSPGYDWPEAACICPCFHPGCGTSLQYDDFAGDKWRTGPDGPVCREFVFSREKDSISGWYLEGDTWKSYDYAEGPGKRGNTPMPPLIRNKRYETVPSKKMRGKNWSDSGILIRQSRDGQWLCGSAWEDWMWMESGAPKRCIHVSPKVGPLKFGESKTIRGKLYLMKGTKEELLQRYRADFPKKDPATTANTANTKETK